MSQPIKSPFPYFGGKSRIASAAWQRFGEVRNYVEPFFGSGAVLLQRPQPFDGPETVNDKDGYVANFWRAVSLDPESVAHHADWPVSELDLHARHQWLVNEGRKHVERLRSEPDYYDAKIAGWWVWGACQWIGSGWCSHPECEQLPHLGNTGNGVHRLSLKRPHLGNTGNGESGLDAYFQAIGDRLRSVRVCCGDWSRVCGPSPTFAHGLTAVFLDPPYLHSERDDALYATETDCAPDVRKWCLENGDNKQLRIILCGYSGEGHEELESRGWDCVAWKAHGGYSCQGANSRGRSNANRERYWCSPHCVPPNQRMIDFTEDAA